MARDDSRHGRHPAARNAGTAQSLPADRAFVVQLSATTDVDHRRLSGRVEHVVTGHSMHFRSLEQLLAFFGCPLRERA
jgi:hypothetical protein